MASEDSERLLVQIASYNTNLQGVFGLPQDLVDWLSPTFQVSAFLSQTRRAPDIIAVGFQELLPLHLGRQFFSLPLYIAITSIARQFLASQKLSSTIGMPISFHRSRRTPQIRNDTR